GVLQIDCNLVTTVGKLNLSQLFDELHDGGTVKLTEILPVEDIPKPVLVPTDILDSPRGDAAPIPGIPDSPRDVSWFFSLFEAVDYIDEHIGVDTTGFNIPDGSSRR